MKFGRKKELETTIESGENAIANKEVEGLSQGQIVLRRFLRHRAAVISLSVITGILLFVFSSLDMKIGPFQYRGWWKFGIDD
ncbi:MAG: ABC transporter permease, partial [Actinobacteria bacterium]|nr:ABC transporter permease [Actinomycetota bacterium]